MALTQLAAYATSSSDSVVSRYGWVAVKVKARGFLLGAALASYVLLLRPVFYEALWFAVLYEWLVVMAVVFVGLLQSEEMAQRRRGISDALLPGVGQTGPGTNRTWVTDPTGAGSCCQNWSDGTLNSGNGEGSGCTWWVCSTGITRR